MTTESIEIFCYNCQRYVIPSLIKSGPHIRADCPSCGGYLKFLNRKEKGEEVAELEIFFEIPENKYGEGIMLEEYNDRISLVSAQKAKGEGTTYKKWCFPQTKDRVPAEKAIPWKIQIGRDRKEATEMLRKIAMELKS